MDFLAKFVDFIQELFKSISSGYLFFGSVADLIRSFCDIALIAFLVYWALVFIKHSRAWQLIKGIIFLYCFVLICSLFGLQMVGYIFSNFLYIFTIMLVVIFQPELRRLLETVGIKSFTSIRGVVTGNPVENKNEMVNLINEICDACKEMCKTYTGALILLERNTKLDELLIQDNTAAIESSVTSIVLQSLFYKGAPMHDGAVLIRDGKIIAARCHINAQVTLHSLDRAGTRHKAAVGASEMGDTVAIAVSEERGKASIAVNGRLYEMKSNEELKANLLYLFGLTEDSDNKSGISKALKGFSKKKKKDSKASSNSPKVVVAQSEENKNVEKVEKANVKNAENNKYKSPISEKILLVAVSILISTGLWIYIQINNNPVISRSYVVPITYEDAPEYEVSFPIDTVEVKIVGRQNTLDRINANNILATIDFDKIEDSGFSSVPVIVKSKDSNVYFRVEQLIPESVPITVYTQN